MDGVAASTSKEEKSILASADTHNQRLQIVQIRKVILQSKRSDISYAWDQKRGGQLPYFPVPSF